MRNLDYTDAPLTKAVAWGGVPWNNTSTATIQVVNAEFAAQLERELNKLLKEREYRITTLPQTT